MKQLFVYVMQEYYAVCLCQMKGVDTEKILIEFPCVCTRVNNRLLLTFEQRWWVLAGENDWAFSNP